MKTKTLTFLATGAGLLLAASPAMAVVIDDVVIPTSPGDHYFVGNIEGTRATGIGDSISGGGQIYAFDGQEASTLCTTGSCDLQYSFSGYTLANITNGGTTGFFTGGQVTFTIDGETFLTAEADRLPSDPVTSVDDTQYTLIATKATAAEQNGAFGLLSVTGGDAASVFDTDSYDNGEGGLSDLLFNTSWTALISEEGDQIFKGSNDIHFSMPSISVPEPSQLGLLILGLGLIGAGVAVRRRKDA